MAILDLITRHEARLTQSINLVASENLLSNGVKRALSSDLSSRYCIPPEGERPEAIWDYPNQEFARQIATETEVLAKQLFSAKYADVRPLSGNQIAQIILMSVASRGDTVWSVPAKCGGHFATPVIAKYAGLNLVPMPYDNEAGIIDVGAARYLAKRHPPKLVFLDASMQVFPHPVAELREVLGSDPIISYDASHTLGLIAGGGFQCPLLEGADLLHGSTHKSLWGPQKGVITARENGSLASRVKEAVIPLYVSNVHVHHVAALGVAFEESRDFGAAYAQAVISNAKALAATLAEHGIDVLFADRGATECHQILIDLGDKAASMLVWNQLQLSGLNTNAIALPFRSSYGLRIGVAEATRRGFDAVSITELGRLMARCILGAESTVKIAHCVAEMSKKYSVLRFSHDEAPIF